MIILGQAESFNNGGTRGAPIMPRDAVSRTANVERTGRHKWVNQTRHDRNALWRTISRTMQEMLQWLAEDCWYS